MSLLLIISNIVAVEFLPFLASKIVLIISTFSFVLFFLRFKPRNLFVIIFSILLLFTDFLDIFYSKPLGLEVYSIFRTIAYTVLSIGVFKAIHCKTIDFKTSFLLVVVGLVNVLIAYTSVSLAPDLSKGSFRFNIIFINWVLCIVASVFVTKNYFQDSSKASFLLMLSTFLLVFSEFCGFIHDFFHLRYFTDFEMLLYFLGFLFLSLYFIRSNDLDDKELLQQDL